MNPPRHCSRTVMAEITRIPLLDLTRGSGDLHAELSEASQRVLKSGRFILGPEVEALERECAAYIGARHAIGVSSGTDALLLALMALGIGAGDEVICPTFTFFATAGAVWRSGAQPVFVDSRPCCFNCDPQDIEGKVTQKTKAILPVHLFGQCADLDPILEIAHARELPVIEDAAQAIGAEYKGQRAGSMGTIGCFSFFPTKNLGGFGDGGLVTTNDDELAEKARVLRVHGGKPKYHHNAVGGNFRLDELQAALLRVKLKRLDQATSRRQQNAALYSKLFREAGIASTPSSACSTPTASASSSASDFPLSLPVECQQRHIYNQYVIRVRGEGNRDQLRNFLGENGIGTEIYYPIPLHLQGCFAACRRPEESFPVAGQTAHEALALPIFPELREDEIRYVVGKVVEFADSRQRSAQV